MAGREPVNLIGQTFARLTVIERAPYRLNDATWVCRCTCGNLTDATTYQLRHGRKRSCGCLNKKGVKSDDTGRSDASSQAGTRAVS